MSGNACCPRAARAGPSAAEQPALGPPTAARAGRLALAATDGHCAGRLRLAATDGRRAGRLRLAATDGRRAGRLALAATDAPDGPTGRPLPQGRATPKDLTRLDLDFILPLAPDVPRSRRLLAMALVRW